MKLDYDLMINWPQTTILWNDNNRGDGTERDNGSTCLHREPSRPTDPRGESDPSLLVKVGLFGTICGWASSCYLCWTVNYGCGDRHTIFHLTGTICWSRDLSLTQRWTWSSTCEHLHRHDDDDDHHENEDHEDDIEDDHNCGLQDDPQSHTPGGFWPDD